MNSLSTQNCLSCHKDLSSGVSVCSECAETQAVSDEVSSEWSASSRCQTGALDDGVVMADGCENADMPAPPVSAADNDESQDVSLDFIALDEDEDEAEVPPPAPSASDAQDMSLDCIAIDDSSCLPDVPPPAPSASDAQDMSLDCIAIDDSSCLPDVPPPAPGCEVPPPAPSASDAQDMSLDCIAIDDSSCLREVPPPAPSASDAQDMSLDCIAIDDSSCLPDVPPPAPGCDVPPPAPSASDAQDMSLDCIAIDDSSCLPDVPPPAPGCDVPPPAPGSAMGPGVDLGKGTSKSSISFAVQAETLSVSENVQTFEMNQETPDTNGRFYLNSDINVIPEVSETTSISAEFALADTGVVPVPDASAEFEGEDEECDKTAAYDRPAFLDAFVSADELKEAVQSGDADLPESGGACADRDVPKSENPVESEPQASDEEIDDTMIAPSRPVQQDTSAGLKAVPLRTLSQLSFGQSLAVSSNIQAQKQNSHALLENVENTPDTKGELKSKLSDGKADKGLDAKTLKASDAKDEAANARTVAQQAKPAASQSHENNKAASSSSEGRKVSPGDQIVEALPEPESEVSEAKTFSLGQVVTIIVLFLVIIFLILFLIYSLFIKSPVIV